MEDIYIIQIKYENFFYDIQVSNVENVVNDENNYYIAVKKDKFNFLLDKIRIELNNKDISSGDWNLRLGSFNKNFIYNIDISKNIIAVIKEMVGE